MKNKKFLTALVAIALVFSLVLGIGIVNTPKVYAEAELPALTNVSVDENGVLHWNPYDGDTPTYWNYYVNFDGTDYMTVNNNASSYDLKTEAQGLHLPTGTYNWSVRAIKLDDADGVDYISDLTSPKTGTYNFVNEQEAYAAPTNLTWTNATISWDATTNTAGYKWYLYDATTNKLLTYGSATGTSKTFTTSGYLEAGKPYYFEVQALANDTDLDHNHSLKARSANKTYNVVATINNVKIDEEGLLTFDPINIEGVKYYIDFYVGPGSHSHWVSRTTLPINIKQIFTDYSGWPKTTPYTLEILAYDEATNVPLTAMYRINNWTYCDTYVQPVAQTNGGLSAGAIVAIVLAVVIVGGCGGFAVVWFVVKKKTWADFVALFKKK